MSTRPENRCGGPSMPRAVQFPIGTTTTLLPTGEPATTNRHPQVAIVPATEEYCIDELSHSRVDAVSQSRGDDRGQSFRSLTHRHSSFFFGLSHFLAFFALKPPVSRNTKSASSSSITPSLMRKTFLQTRPRHLRQRRHHPPPQNHWWRPSRGWPASLSTGCCHRSRLPQDHEWPDPPRSAVIVQASWPCTWPRPCGGVAPQPPRPLTRNQAPSCWGSSSKTPGSAPLKIYAKGARSQPWRASKGTSGPTLARDNLCPSAAAAVLAIRQYPPPVRGARHPCHNGRAYLWKSSYF